MIMMSPLFCPTEFSSFCLWKVKGHKNVFKLISIKKHNIQNSWSWHPGENLSHDFSGFVPVLLVNVTKEKHVIVEMRCQVI